MKVLELNKIYSSNFARAKKYVRKGRMVSISISSPDTFEGGYCKYLRPPEYLKEAYKNGEIEEEYYTIKYYEEVLRQLDAVEVYKELKGKVICCWCEPSSFCHRHLVLEWLRVNLGGEVIGGEL